MWLKRKVKNIWMVDRCYSVQLQGKLTIASQILTQMTERTEYML